MALIPFGPREPPKVVACGVMAIRLFNPRTAQANVSNHGLVITLPKGLRMLRCLYWNQALRLKAVLASIDSKMFSCTTTPISELTTMVKLDQTNMIHPAAYNMLWVSPRWILCQIC